MVRLLSCETRRKILFCPVKQNTFADDLLYRQANMHFSTLYTVAVYAALASTSPTTTRHVLHERRVNTPRYWEKVSRVSPDIVLPIRIGMTQSNLDQGHDMLMDV